VRSVEWSGVSGVDSHGSVPGFPRASTFSAVHIVHGHPLPGAHPIWTPLFAIATESPQHHDCSISCFENSLINRFTNTFLFPDIFY